MLFSRLIERRTQETGRIYLDHAAATPVRTEVLEAMEPYWDALCGNPSAIHREGQKARQAIDTARSGIAELLHIREHGVVFTASGTEANNLALYGLIRAAQHSSKYSEGELEVVTTAVEHPSVTNVLADLARQGVGVHTVRIDEEGFIDESHFLELLSEHTVLVTFAYANSETGVVQDVKRLSRIVRQYNSEHGTEILVHIDAAQAPLWLPLEMDMLGVDLISLDGGKCCGPKGVGVLAFRHGVTLEAFVKGGGQEGGLRAGTENTPLIVGCALALRIAADGREERCEKVSALRDQLIGRLLAEIPECELNGSTTSRLANNVNISISGIDSEYAVVTLDAHGIAASTKSACSSEQTGGSAVVREMTGDEERASSTIRFSLGEETAEDDIETVVQTLKRYVEKMADIKPEKVEDKN